jgi:tRNA(Ile)-lysidine synthase
MDRLGPFEPKPRVAVGVSGGADSLALTLLVDGWARTRGGVVRALTVDHGLRPESADEAAAVAAALGARGISHAILAWQGEKPVAGLQAAAREARHRLLMERCRAEGILHLALAHHLEDQAETVLLRFAKGSGPDGLAGMAVCREQASVRLLRPLLDTPRARLASTCAAAGLAWIDDPANRATAFARGRLRAAAAVLGREGLQPQRLVDAARRAGRARAVLEVMTATTLARAVALFPEGYALVDLAVLLGDAPEELALRALGRCLVAIGGGVRQPRLAGLERLRRTLTDRNAKRIRRTLGGCRVIGRGGTLLIVREAAAAGERRPIEPGTPVHWDRRFRITLAGGRWDGPLAVARLGEAGWATLRRAWPDLARPGLPAAARATLPAIWDATGLLAVPHLAYLRPGRGTGDATVHVLFAPCEALAGPPFAVV